MRTISTTMKPLMMTGPLLVLSLALNACSPAKQSDLLQICFNEEKELTEFALVFKAIGHAEGQAVIDSSAQVRRDAEAIDRVRPHSLDLSRPIMMITFDRKDGSSASAYTQGMPGYQVVVGISEGRDPNEFKAFKERVVGSLEQHWPVFRIPEDVGATPLKGCA